MATNETLFPNLENRKKFDDQLTDILQTLRGQESDRKVVPNEDLTQFRNELSKMEFNTPTDLFDLVNWTVDKMDDGIVHMTNPRYFGLFNPTPTYPAECADRIASVFNPQICVWSHAPVAVEIERHVIEQIARRAGLTGDIGGHFTSGGSEANNTAVICSLTVANSKFSEIGSRAFSGQPRIYVSKESHLAWLKIAHLVGIGREAVRLVNTDGNGRMDTIELAKIIASDKQSGDIPVMIGATAGTTNAGVIDPLSQCHQIAKENDLWFHVDAAWGGALISSSEAKIALAGIELADSITIDAHKWFATTMGAGMFLTRRKAVLGETFRVAASYMPESNVEDDLYVNSIMWSRRFVGLRLFLSLGSAGWQGYEEHVTNSIELIEYLSEQLTKHGWTRVNDTPLAVACFLPPADTGSVENHVERINNNGQSWISAAKFESQSVLRACVTNGRATQNDVDMLITELTQKL